VDTIPKVKITGASEVCIGKPITLTSSIAGGTWSSSHALRATISATGVVTGIVGGMVTISYSYTNNCGTFTATQPLMVYTSAQCDSMLSVSMMSPDNNPFSIKLFPNPNEGDFSVIVNSLSNEPIQLRIITAVGQEVWRGASISNVSIDIKNILVPGVYTLIADDHDRRGIVKFICIRP
jgi:hypothetical protein